MDGGLDVYALETVGGKLVWHKNSETSTTARMLACDGKAISTADRGVRFGLKSVEGKVPAPAIPGDAHNRDVLLPAYILGKTATLTMTPRAMLSAGDVVFAAGYTDARTEPTLLWRAPGKNASLENVPEVHPLTDLGPAKGDWTLWAFSAADGRRLGELKLPAEPVWDGLAAAQDRLYLSTADGKVRCFGPQ